MVNILSAEVLTASAETLLPDALNQKCPPGYKENLPEGQKANCGDYQLNDFLRIAVNISRLILGLVGSLALLAFVAGGLMMMLSAGNAEWVTRGKQTLIGAVIGLVVVFTSYAIIQLVFTSLGIEGTESGQNKLDTWATSGWFKDK